jgi:putative protease
MFNKSYPITTDKSTGAGFNRDLALKYFSKTGDTPFELENIEINAPEDIFIPPKEINHIRREFFKVLTEYTESVFQKDSPKVKFEYPSQLDFETEKERFSIKIDNPDYIKPALNEADRLIIELSINMLNNIKQTLDIIRPFNSQTILFSLPPIIRQEHIPMYVKAIDKYLISSGYSNFQISNLFGLEIFRCKDITLTADFPLYIFNHLSYQTLNKLGIKEGTISPELNKAELDKIIPIIKNRCDLILYSDLPYFYSANCTEASIRGNCLGKKTCGFSQIQFKNFEGDTFIAENNSCTTILINKKAFSLSRHLNYFKQLGQKMFRIDFLYKKYTAQEIKEIIRHVKSGKRIENTIEGNHERELF